MLSLTVSRMCQRGMFLDGVTYAAIARNMAAGIGDFWSPSLSQTIYPRFAEHLPLALGLQALAFALFGDHPAVERGYAITVFLLNGLLIAAIARRLLPPAFDWVPLLLWWSVGRHLERRQQPARTTQAVFTSLACSAILRIRVAGSRRPRAASAASGAASIVAATLAKGPVGLFPIALPLLLPLAPRSARPPSPPSSGRCSLVCCVASAFALLAVRAIAAGASRRSSSRSSHRRSPAAAAEVSAAPMLLRHVGSGIGLRLAIVLWPFGSSCGGARSRTAEAAVFLLAIAVAASAPIVSARWSPATIFFPSTIFFALGARRW